MIIMPVPDGSVAKRMFRMDRDMAERQVKLVVDAYKSLAASKTTLQAVAEGQTTSVWTADGKSVELASMLTARYNATLAWRQALESQLDRAREILRLAIDSTTQFDEETQQRYIAMLDSADKVTTDGATAV
ncbi:MAG: hypothetical protein JF592_09030 [Microbacterium sp.]|uniref:hypothetical protein n=1 Tax=unclassified Microbacterium TaxID=2609290 RepID=UPI001DBB74D2|nr:hypothetical protein [Microbacterium sp.]MBW8762711.1 hypothetical protein [Microbacterium sp.]